VDLLEEGPTLWWCTAWVLSNHSSWNLGSWTSSQASSPHSRPSSSRFRAVLSANAVCSAVHRAPVAHSRRTRADTQTYNIGQEKRHTHHVGIFLSTLSIHIYRMLLKQVVKTTDASHSTVLFTIAERWMISLTLAHAPYNSHPDID